VAEALTSDRILEAAEQVLRRFGPSKTTVVDVARALGVSHGSVYRHFASKTELLDAVVEGWLKRTSSPLDAIADGDGPPRERLREWLRTLVAIKRSKVSSDPEMFAASREVFAEVREVVGRHIATLEGQLERILVDGVARGDFALADTRATAQAIFDATARFHDPAHAAEWKDAGIDAAFERVWTLIEATLHSPR
jgi:AcrR family transcriptional regulator